MPRSKTILQSEYPYHISARCHNQSWFSLPLENIWDIMSRELNFIHRAYQARIHAFVLMHNHFHLLLSTPDSNVDKCLWHFMSYSSHHINEMAGKVNQVFGNRHYKCIVKHPHYFRHAYKYIYRNPVEAGLSTTCEEYRYSTLHGLIGKSHLFIPTEEDGELFLDPAGQLSWLNNKPDADHWKQVGFAMHKKEFKLTKSTYKASHCLEHDSL